MPGTPAGSALRFASPHFRLERLTDGVFAAIATRDGLALSNSTLVDLGEETLIFDTTMGPDAGADLRRAARALFGERPIVLAISHYHWDHHRGSQQFPGSRIFGTLGTREKLLPVAGPPTGEERAMWESELLELERQELPEAERAMWRNVFRATIRTLPQLQTIPPDRTFEESVELHGSNRSARLVTFGGGHSISDAFLHLPSDRTVAAGDLVSVRCHPSLGDGDPARWRGILDRMLALGFDRVVPGHGDVGGPEDLRTVREYIETLEERTRTALAAGADPATAAIGPVPAPYDAWWLRSLFEQNVRFLYRRAASEGAGPLPPK